jgi:hypothetical protein
VTIATFYNQNCQPGGDGNEAVNGNIMVFPNPVKESAWIRCFLDERADVTLTVFRTDGQCLLKIPKGIMEQGEHLLFWNPGELSRGMYILQLSAGEKQLRQRIMVIR